MNRATKMTIPYSRPRLGSEEEEAVLRVLRSGWLTTGKEAALFEREFNELLAEGNEGLSAIAVSSATAGLHLGLNALKLEEGSEVILSPYTFAASINSILYNNLVPRLIDTVPGGYHLDPDLVAKELEINKKVKACMPVHFAGIEQYGREIQDAAENSGIQVIEDAAHSLPGRAGNGQYQGTRGKMAVYSFYANKTITTGEGGMVITRDPEIAEHIRTLRLHGINKDVWSRYTSTGAGYEYDIIAPGFKYNMPDILAAIGRVQLRKAEQFLKDRQILAAAYSRAFADRDWCSLPPGWKSDLENPEKQQHSWHVYSFRIRPDKLTLSRDEFIGKLNDAGIGTSVHFIPLHTMTYYRERFGYKAEDFPNALSSSRESISLPIFPGLSPHEQSYIIDMLLKIGDTHYKR